MANYRFITVGCTRIRVSCKAAWRWDNLQKLISYADGNYQRRLEALRKGNSRKAVNLLTHYLENTVPQMTRARDSFFEALTESEREKVLNAR